MVHEKTAMKKIIGAGHHHRGIRSACFGNAVDWSWFTLRVGWDAGAADAIPEPGELHDIHVVVTIVVRGLALRWDCFHTRSRQAFLKMTKVGQVDVAIAIEIAEQPLGSKGPYGAGRCPCFVFGVDTPVVNRAIFQSTWREGCGRLVTTKF